MFREKSFIEEKKEEEILSAEAEKIFNRMVQLREDKDIPKLVAFFKYSERLEELYPKKGEIDLLLTEDREKFLKFYGRLTAALGVTITAHQWGEDFSFECAGIKLDSKGNERLVQLIDNLVEMAVIYREVEKNSNTYQTVYRGQLKATTDLAEQYQKEGKRKEAEGLLNPFGLERGAILYSISGDGKGLEEKKIDDFIFDGVDSIVIMEGEDFELDYLNKKMASGLLALRDGSNFFGGWRRFEKYHFTEGERMKIRIGTVFEQKEYQVEYLGDNKQELEERYGRAYLLAANHFLKARVRSLADGREAEIPYEDFTVVDN